MWQAGVTSFLFVAAASGVAPDEGVSLLQTQAQLHTQKEKISPGVDNGLGLPDPKKQSSASGKVEINMADSDFECKNGKGKWVWINMGPVTPGPGNGQAGGRSTDLSEKTRDIQDTTQCSGPDCQYRAQPWKKIDGGFTTPTYTDHGPVTDEKDCFHRAKIDQLCNHWVEDIVYSKSSRVLGVWYNGNNPSYTRQGLSSCMCAMVHDLQKISNQEVPGEVDVGNKDSEGFWFCQLLDGDRNFSENAPKEDTPKEKKTPEEKAACKAAKTTNKEDKAAWKALRQQMKALRAQVKAAREKFRTSKVAKEEAC